MNSMMFLLTATLVAGGGANTGFLGRGGGVDIDDGQYTNRNANSTWELAACGGNESFYYGHDGEGEVSGVQWGTPVVPGGGAGMGRVWKDR